MRAARRLPHVHETVVHMLAAAAERSPQGEALVCDEERLTYEQYLRCVAGFSHELAGLGARGKFVAVICGNSNDMAIAMFGIHAAGAIAVPINPVYSARELAFLLADCRPMAVICDSGMAARVEPLAREQGIAHLIRIGGGEGRRLTAWRDDAGARLPAELPGREDIASLQYTGGTTGSPKGAIIRHGPLSINISQREALLPTRPGNETVLCVMPLFHVFASAMCLHLTAYCRGRMVILRRYHPDLVFDALEQEKVTRLPAGPTVFIGLMSHPRMATTDFSSLACAYSGSAPLPGETLKQWQQATGAPILEGYGQSEAGPVLTYIAEGGRIVPGSVGEVVPQTEVQIVDVDSGTRVLGPGERGEIRARGPQVMAGYYNRPEETAAALRGGWLYTGDIGEFDEDGYLYIRDRKKDMAIVGGYNVYPREIDEVLYGHPDVLEAAAVGVPDAYRGEVIRAYVVARPGCRLEARDVADHCAANLARYKLPAAIEIVTELPKTTVGKIDKKALRAQAGRGA
ncbi:MAG: AMP-binding protein [Rhodobiaceae bacterium]|nr:AMP-binding protein [Rhodobiaceae bacterium]